MCDFLLHGLNLTDLGLFLSRIVLGTFFLSFRFRWFYDPSRPKEPWFNSYLHAKLLDRLKTCNYCCKPCMGFAVAATECGCGLALILGVLSVPAAFGIVVVMLFATYCTAVDSVKEQCPIDRIDCLCRYLYTVEPLYLLLAVGVVLMGPGRWSLDWWLFQ